MANGNGYSQGSGENAGNRSQQRLRSEELLTLPINDVYRRLETSGSGLSGEQAEQRLDVYGPNELAKRKKRSAFIQFLMNFKSPLVIILMVAGLISGVLGEITNAVIIYTIVFLITITKECV